MKAWKVSAALLAAGLIALAPFALNTQITRREYTVETKKLPQGQTIRFLLITDLHSQFFGENQGKLIEKIRAERPDALLLAGDIVDDRIPFDGARAFLQQAAAIAPTYYVTGNHEVRTGRAAQICDVLAGYGVHILHNRAEILRVRGSQVVIAGVADPTGQSNGSLKPALDRLWAKISGLDCYKVLITHRPELAELYARYGFDLVCAGHAHGGQWRFPPFVNGLIAPDAGIFPKYAGGRYQLGSQTLIVSRGLYVSRGIPRIFNPPELPVVDVTAPPGS